MTVSANLDLVRSIYAPVARGDFSSSADWAHAEIECVIADGPSPGSWRGLAGLAEANRNILGAWDEWRVKVDEYRELDSERVLALVNYSGRGKRSGIEVGRIRAKGAHLFHVRNGKVTRYAFYFDRERALADLGLAPEGGSA